MTLYAAQFLTGTFVTLGACAFALVWAWVNWSEERKATR